MKDRILMLREALNLSQDDFAEKIGLSRSGISNLENGIRPVSERHIRLIAAAFPRVNVRWLRTGEGTMFYQPPSNADEIAQKFDFHGIIAQLLKTYDQLNSDQQEAVLTYARRVIAGVLDGVTIEEKVASYRQELLLEKETQTSSASQTGGEERSIDIESRG